MWPRRLALALTIAGLLGLSAAPVLAAPANVFISDPVTGGIDCGAEPVHVHVLERGG